MIRSIGRLRPLGVLATALALAGSVAVALPPTHAHAGRVAQIVPPEPIALSVMEFNVEYGGIHVSWDKTLEVIAKGDADVVGIEEAQGHTARLARAAGYPYFSPRMQVLSKYPIVDPPGGDSVYVFIEVAPGQIVAMENVHLPSNPYGPFRVKQGYSRTFVVDLERRLRVPAIRPSLHAAKPLVEQGIPVFLTGDFNTPSWRDWTPEMVGERYQIVFPVKWPVSIATEKAGFIDSYRSVHPDPKRDPGLTWWAARPDVPGWDPGAHAAEDRIDFVYAAGPAEATESLIVGERGQPVADLHVDPWPSDHRATVSSFSVTPAEMPVLVAVAQRLLPVGKDLTVRFHATGTNGEAVALVPVGGDPASDALDQQPTGHPAPVDGELTFGTGALAPGSYEAVLLDGSGGELSRIAFWLKEPGTGAVVSTGMATYQVGEPIDVSWTDARGERWDWIGVYKRHRDPHIAYYLLWAYTRATVEGSLVLDDYANGRFPLPAGDYSVYILRDDGYVKMAGTDFRIVE